MKFDVTISVDVCLTTIFAGNVGLWGLCSSTSKCSHSKQWMSIALTGNSMEIAGKFWDKYHSNCVKNSNFTNFCLVKFYHFQCNTHSIYPKCHCYPCYN